MANNKQLDKQAKKEKEEAFMLLLLSNKVYRCNLINKLRLDRAFAVGFCNQLTKRTFRNTILRNFFFNIYDYIESSLYSILYEAKHHKDKIRYKFAECSVDYLADLFWNFRL